MTNKEAIKCLECDFYNMECCTEEECKCNEAITMAIEALEKNEPRKIKNFHHCPNCGFSLPAKGITNEWCNCCFNSKYCPECGQALEWSDEE